MLIYVCSQYKGNPPHSTAKSESNLRKAAEYSKEVIGVGHTPITPHLFFHALLDDTVAAERKCGMDMGIELLRVCDAVWVFGEVSAGMQAEIDEAWLLNIPIVRKEQDNET
jgi:hypothetical protein